MTTKVNKMDAFDEQWLVTLKIEMARRRAAREEERRKDEEAIAACNRIEDPDLRQVLLHLLHKATKLAIMENKSKLNRTYFCK